MQWTPNEAATKTLQGLFQKPYSIENPFYNTFDEKFKVAAARPGKSASSLVCCYANQMMAYRVNAHTFDLYLSYVAVYKMSTRETANILLKCRWNKQTGKLTQIDAQYTTNRYAQTGVKLNVRRTGTIDQLFDELAEAMTSKLSSIIKGYWEGFTKYYANKTKSMSGYYLD